MLSTLHKDFAFSGCDRFLQQSSMAFDLSIVQIFSALCSGARVCVASSEIRKDPYSLADFMKQQGVTVTYFTPTQFTLLLETNREALQECHDYRVAFFAGERLPVRVARAFYDLATAATVYNTWSPSELVVQTTIAQINNPEESVVNLPIGRPLDNCRHYVLDPRGNPLPPCFVGELVVGGAQVGQGYLNRPAENQKSFVEDPFCSEEDRSRGWTRMFRTGDRGKFLPGGQLEFHGRIAGDKQIKLRGFRVDLGEVEHCIYQSCRNIHKGLIDIAVIARPREGDIDDIQLVAFLVPSHNFDKGEQRSFVTEIHEIISPQLNYYMLPSGYHFLERLPVTIGGKVDRRALLGTELDLVQPYSGVANVTEDTNGVEKSVLDIFQNTLGSTGSYTQLTDNFFHRGGNSILLVRLQTEIRNRFQITPSLDELFQEPTAAAVSSYIESRQGANGARIYNAADSVIDWKTESKLPLDSRYPPQHGNLPVPRHDITDVLIAGAMSPISAHLIADILHTKRNVHIYVLGLFDILTFAAVIDELGKHGLLNGKTLSESDILERVTAVEGALVQTNLGLSKSAFRKLGQTVQSIYYLGGEVSLLQTYTHLKTSNVLPVLGLIQLAGMGDSVSELHYLSTWSVSHLQAWPTSQRTLGHISTTEGNLTHFLPPSGDNLGYFKSRWVAENLLVQAAERGFPVTITRAAAITASSRSKDSSTTANPSLDDFTVQMVLGMIETGTVPQIGAPTDPPFAVDIMPVDYLAAAFVALTARATVEEDSNSATVYHLGNPRPLEIADLPGVIGKMRPDLEQSTSIVPLEEWLQKMEGAAGVEDAAAAMVRSAVLKQYFVENQHVMFSLDRTETKKVLDKIAPHLEERCPAVDPEFLGEL